MKKTLILMALVASMPLACKSKKGEMKEKKSTDTDTPLLRTDSWLGNADKIDPQIGKVKNIELIQ